jgi:hypothetical protein
VSELCIRKARDVIWSEPWVVGTQNFCEQAEAEAASDVTSDFGWFPQRVVGIPGAGCKPSPPWRS